MSSLEKAEKAEPTGLEVPVLEDGRVSTTYPVGAVKAWLTLAGSFMLQVCALGALSTFGVFQEFYTTTWLTQYPTQAISWIGSVELCLGLGTGFISGKLSDGGYTRYTIIFGSTLLTFSYFMLSLAKQGVFYQHFLAQGLGMGLGISFVFIPTCTLVSYHFRARKALAMGILVASAPLGGIIFSVMLNKLIHSSVGFHWAVRATAFVVAGLSILGNMLITAPVKPSSEEDSNAKGGLKQLKQLPYLLIVVAGFLSQLGSYFPIFFVQLYAKKHPQEISDELRFYSLAILNAASVVGRTAPSYFADKYGAINVYIVVLALNGAAGFAMLGARSVAGLTLFCLFDGFFFGSVVSLFLPLIASLAPIQKNMGMTMGLAMAPIGISSLIGPPIAAATLGANLVWWRGITFASGCLILASFSAMVARYFKMRKSKLDAQTDST